MPNVDVFLYVFVAACLLLMIGSLGLAVWAFDQMGRKSQKVAWLAQHPASKTNTRWDYPGAQSQGIEAGRYLVVLRAREPFIAQIGFDLVMPRWYLFLASVISGTPKAKLRGTSSRPFFDPTGEAESRPDGNGHVVVFSMWLGKSPCTYRVLKGDEEQVDISLSRDPRIFPSVIIPSHFYVRWFDWYN